MKGPVTIREKRMKNGGASLFLDIYVDGVRKKEYLKLYLKPEKTKEDRKVNKEIRRMAEQMAAQRTLDIHAGRLNLRAPQLEDIRLSEFMDEFIAMKRRQGVSASVVNQYIGAARKLRGYDKNNIAVKNITPRWVRGFRDYLVGEAINERSSAPLKKNTQHLFYNLFRIMIRHAMRDGVLVQDPTLGVPTISAAPTERTYLTVEEMRVLAATECRQPRVKDAFLFACLTGLRFSDIIKLTWYEVRQEGEFCRIVFRQKKTGAFEYIDISPQAVVYMGERGDAELTDKVFLLPTDRNCHVNRVLKRWVADAGIKKHVTFHVARHTFAVVLLDLGADIFTVSKLLGHRDLATTQVYAKVLDRKKQEAAMMLPSLK